MPGFTDYVNLVGERLSNNLSSSFSNLSATQWIRLIAVTGAYLLLRPYLMKLGARAQMRQHEADEKAAEEEAAAIAAGRQAALSPNALRESGTRVAQKVAVPADSDSEEDDDLIDGRPKDAATSAVDWGKNARRRQRKFIRKMLEEHERKLAEEQADEEDKDIQEFLVE